MRSPAATPLALTVVVLLAAGGGCGGELVVGDGGDDADADGRDSGDADPEPDARPDAEPDAEPEPDADPEQEPPPESCDFGYASMFATSLPPPGPWSPPTGERRDEADDERIRWIAHAEPEPPELVRLTPKDPDDPDLVMPGYSDDMPLFERAGAWSSERRCYETPAGVMLLTESEAWELYRDIAELTTGVAMSTSPGVRSIVGLRGAYPGTFAWHGNAPNRFNDTLVLLWVDDNDVRHVREFAAATDTGAHDFGHDSSSSLMPNRRYRYVNGWHRGYNALRIDESGYRVRDDSNHNGHWDSDRNGWLPPRTADDRFRTGGGHNIHLASVDAPLGTAAVGVWSAGCQVIPGAASWTELIYRAWTREGDPVDYFLVDVRDIDPAVWWEPCEPAGTHACPFRIDSLPFEHDFDTAGWPESVMDVYSCSPADESGPEVVYLLTLDRSGTLAVSVDCVEPVDIDVHLLMGDEATACLTRAHESFEYSITPGRYLVVADTWVDGTGTARSGPYRLRVALR